MQRTNIPYLSMRLVNRFVAGFGQRTLFSFQIRRISHIIYGLGNTGDCYAGTRHNVGAEAVQEFMKYNEKYQRCKWSTNNANGSSAKETILFHKCPDIVANLWKKRKLHTRSKENIDEGQKVIVFQPRTFMNTSGDPLKRFLHNHTSVLKDQSILLILMDDVHLPFGVCKFSSKGSDGGQLGLRSVMNELGTSNIPRLRIGIGNDMLKKNGPLSLPRFVLSTFDKYESRHKKLLFQYISNLLEVYIHRGIEDACSIANGSSMFEMQGHFRKE